MALPYTTTCYHMLQHTTTICHYILQHTATHCSILQQSLLSVLQHTATHCNTLQQIATYLNTPYLKKALRHTTAYCNTMKHTATIPTLRRRIKLPTENCNSTCATEISHFATISHSATHCATHCNTLATHARALTDEKSQRRKYRCYTAWLQLCSRHPPPLLKIPRAGVPSPPPPDQPGPPPAPPML